jgi:putative SOS response-associated peptidase YedK
MCGRYAATKDPAALVEEFAALDLTGGETGTDYNVAPTKNVVTVVQRHPRDAEGDVLEDEPAVRSLRVMRWGLVPFWAKDPKAGAKMINTRAETAQEKPAFRKALSARRCLVPADGWYEWKRDGKEKEDSLVFGGIWETWRPKDEAGAEPLITFSVITTDSVGRLTDIHHRMPLLLPRARWDEWLDPDRPDVAELLAPPSAELVDTLELRPVSNLVNSVRNNGPQLLDRVEPGPVLDDAALFELPSS